MDEKTENKISNKRHLDSSGDETKNSDAKKQKIFQYGNYSRYYGYRNANKDKDKRINAFQEDWFSGKSCLDIGCNVGHLTLWLTKHFKVKAMKGIDIDCKLIQAAKSNVLHYLNDGNNNRKTEKETVIKEKDEKDLKTSVQKDVKDETRFPYNVHFVTVSILVSSFNCSEKWLELIFK